MMPRLSLTLLYITVGCLCSLVCKGGLVTSLGQNFTASTLFQDLGAVPPDTDGAIGPGHFVEFINGQFAVFDKNSGARVQVMTDRAFWNGAGVTFASGIEISDPRIIYDAGSGRWFASQIDFNRSNPVNNRFLLAVSASSDPTGIWKGVAFQADPAGNFADFPRLGLDSKGVYLSANMFDAFDTLLGVLITSIPKADVLLSIPTATNRTSSGLLSIAARGFTLQPVVNFALTNGPEAVLAVTSDGTDFLAQTNLTMFQILGAQTGTATLSPSTNLTVPAYLVNLNPPQPGGMDTLDDGDARIGSFVFQSGNVLYATHAVQVGSRAAIRWYRINASDNSLLESGTISDTNLDFFYPSIAVGTNGLVVIGFNGCSTNTFVSSYAAVGQTIGNATSFGQKILLKAGVANYERLNNGVSRWGDYTTTTVDVAKPNHFWTIQQFVSSPNVYSTQVTEIIVSEIPPVLQIASSGTDVLVSWPTNDLGFTLQSATNLAPTVVWSPVTNTASVAAGRNIVSIPHDGIDQFFRLKR